MNDPTGLPSAIADYLLQLTTEQHDMAYLQVSLEGSIIISGGSLAKYGLTTAKVGDAIDQHLIFLSGFFPHPNENEVMPYIHTEQGEVVDVHFIADSSNPLRQETRPTANASAAKHWILLLDATTEIKKQQQFQQIANDLALLQEKFTQQINQAHYHPLALPNQLPNTGQVNSQPQQELSILTIKVCHPAFNLTMLNDCLTEATQFVLEENGLVHHAFGQIAVALFGLVPTSQSSAIQAIRTAKRLLKRFTPATCPSLGSAKDHIESYQVGMSIATDDATIGTIQHGQQSLLNVDGPAISVAFAMRDYICKNHLIIDASTLQACNTELDAFSKHLLTNEHPPPLYQLIPTQI